MGRVRPDARSLRWGSDEIEIVATGLRNAWGLAFHPGGPLFATDNGRDDLGDETPPDELNVVLPGRDYGFPSIGGMPPDGHPSEAPVALLDVHGSANGLVFDTGDGLSGFRDQVFIAQWGSWTGSPGFDAGTKIVQGQLHRDGEGHWEFRGRDLVANCGRPLDVEIGARGELFFSVQTSGPGWPEGVYRVVPTHGVVLKLHGHPAGGESVSVTLHASEHVGDAYQIGLSFGTGPITTPRGDLGLAPDALLRYALQPGPLLQLQRPGTVNEKGVSSGPDTIRIPSGGAFSGWTIFIAGVTADPKSGSLTGISPTVAMVIL